MKKGKVRKSDMQRLNVAFEPDEIRLIDEIKAIKQKDTLTAVLRPDIVRKAVIAYAETELGKK